MVLKSRLLTTAFIVPFTVAATLAPARGFEQGNYKRVIVFFSTLIVSYFLTDLIKILLAKRMKSYLKKDNIIKAKKALGILIFVFGLFLIIKGFLPKKTLTSQNLIEGIGM